MASALKFKLFVKFLKWFVIAVVSIDFFSFLAILGLNYFVVGHAAEQKVRYDPYALFLDASPIPRTAEPFLPSEKKQNIVIWMFGGSTLVRGSDTGKTIPSLLSRIMNSEDRQYTFTITNFGVNSFDSLMETRYLQKALIEEDPKPNAILFFDGANDVVWFCLHRDPVRTLRIQ